MIGRPVLRIRYSETHQFSASVNLRRWLLRFDLDSLPVRVGFNQPFSLPPPPAPAGGIFFGGVDRLIRPDQLPGSRRQSPFITPQTDSFRQCPGRQLRIYTVFDGVGNPLRSKWPRIEAHRAGRLQRRRHREWIRHRNHDECLVPVRRLPTGPFGRSNRRFPGFRPSSLSEGPMDVLTVHSSQEMADRCTAVTSNQVPSPSSSKKNAIAASQDQTMACIEDRPNSSIGR